MPMDDLDDLFAAARADRPQPSEALLQRVLADALAQQPCPAPTPVHRSGLLARLSAAFGGGPALAGVCSAAVVGLVLGYLNPMTYDYLTGGLTGAETVDLFPSTDFLSSEG
ncbi:MAG: dihydroorotate dehydrogenase [Alphaproteobacteria bacterium]